MNATPFSAPAQHTPFDPNRFYSQAELDRLGLCGKTTFWRYVKEGLETIKIGTRTKVAGRALNDFIATRAK